MFIALIDVFPAEHLNGSQNNWYVSRTILREFPVTVTKLVPTCMMTDSTDVGVCVVT